MKDFQQVLDSKDEVKEARNASVLTTFAPKEENPILKKLKQYSLKIASPFILSIITGPFSTISILMQITQKPPTFKILQQKIKAAPSLKRYIENGIFGDNRIYQPYKVQGYRDGFAKLGRQGIKGLYKGNLTGLIYAMINTQIRTATFGQAMKANILNERPNWKSNLITIASCSFADFVTLPLMLCQTRLVLQNSASNFRTYRSLFSILKQTPFSLWFSGASLIIAKNTLFSLAWVNLIKESPFYSFILSTFLSHIVIYPFATVIRNLQSNSLDTPMMNDRKQRVRDCVSRIYSKLGVKGFYRGILGYLLVHSFLGVIMIQSSLQNGFFQEQ